MADLQNWINTADAEAYRSIASEYLNKGYSRLAPFELMNWKSGGMASRRVGDMREIVRFSEDGPWRMMVPEEVYVPKVVNKVLESLMNERKGPNALYSVYDKSLDVFRVSALAFSPRFHFYNVIGGGASTYVVTGIPIGTNTINLPSNCDYITGVRIYCYSWSVLSYVHNNSYYCGAQDPYTPPCYAGRYTNNYKCPPDGVSGTTGCDSGSYCIYYQHCNDDNWDGSTGHCMNNGALRIIDLGQNFCPGGGSPRCEFP